jgi:gas vesicle protein
VRSRNRRAAEELDALLDGRLSTDEAGSEVRRLAALASTVVEERPGPDVTLNDDRRLLMRDRLLDEIAAMGAPESETVPAAGARTRRPVRAAVATGLASTMIAATGVTVAAQEALPGDALYGIKKGTETVRMNLASDATQAARLELRFAEARLEEVTAGASRLPSDALIEAMAEMDQRSLAGAQQLVLAAEQDGNEQLLVEVDAFVERQSTGLVEVFARLPIEARPHAEDSLALLRQIRTDLLLPALEACDCLDIVPASHLESEFVPRATSDPLPPAPQQESTQETSSEPSAPAADQRSQDDEPLGDLQPDDVTTNDDSGGLTSRLRDTVDKTTDGVRDTVDSTTDTVEDTVDKTTGGVRDTVDKTTDAVEDTVDKTTETVEDTVDKTTETVEDTVNDTTGTVGDLLGSTTDGLKFIFGR